MARPVYGNEVIYIVCKHEDLETIPIIDGQLIAFVDADGLYYDMGEVRHTLGNFLLVKQLPKVGVSDTLYILKNDSICNLFAWIPDIKDYIQLIPDPAIDEDAPDNNWYFRIKDEWVHDRSTIYLDIWSTEDLKWTNLSKIASSLSDNSYLNIVGDLPTTQKHEIFVGAYDCVLDFSRCNVLNQRVSGPKSEADNWEDIGIYGANVYGLTAKYVKLFPGNLNYEAHISRCKLTDSQIIISTSDCQNITVECNMFKVTKKTYIPLVVEATRGGDQNSDYSRIIQGNIFIFEDSSNSGWPACGLMSPSKKNGAIQIYGNNFINTFALEYEDSVASGSTPYGSNLNAANLFEFNSTVSGVRYNTKTRMAAIRNANTMNIMDKALNIQFFIWACKNSGAKNLFFIYDRWVIKDATDNIDLGVADYIEDSSNPNVSIVFELSPEQFIDYSEAQSKSTKLSSVDSNSVIEVQSRIENFVDISASDLSQLRQVWDVMDSAGNSNTSSGTAVDVLPVYDSLEKLLHAHTDTYRYSKYDDSSYRQVELTSYKNAKHMVVYPGGNLTFNIDGSVISKTTQTSGYDVRKLFLI